MISQKHKIFADTYIETLDMIKSYYRAYPKCTKDSTASTNGSKLLTRPDVNEYIKENMAGKDNARIASAEEVLEKITSIMRNPNNSCKEILKATELLGKRYRLFVDRIEAEVTQTVYFEGEDELED